MLPALFVAALRGNDFIWRGNAMQVERMRPIRMTAPLRPRIQELAELSRRRLRALRARILKPSLNAPCLPPAPHGRRWTGS
jgi:hypothetical protein